MSKECFVFVVCGAQEYIDTLHYSLEYIKKFSRKEIWVITDSSRNENPIIHDHILDVSTPKEFNHHQASIFLKTGIHHHLPKGNRYCYLDSDILALSEEVDEIFKQYSAPITFAPDHCTMEQFSAYALNCDCLKVYESFRNKLDDELVKTDPLRKSNDPKIIKLRKELIAYYESNRSMFSRISLALRYFLSFKTFYLNERIAYSKSRKVWFERQTSIVFMHKLNLAKASRKVGLKWSYTNNYPMLSDGRSLWKNECFHLIDSINKKFNITIEDRFFQHWNGGVFLFDDQSHDFLETWFQATMETFNDPYWKTRDQGTLIKTVWEKGLQNHPTLHKKWNAIADFHNPFLKWLDKKTVQLNQNDVIEPILLHVYHHFGDTTWDFWNEIEKIEHV